MCTSEQLSSAGHDRALQRKALPLPSDQLTYGESDPGCALLSLGAERLIYREGPASQEQILSGQILPSKGLAHPLGIPSNESVYTSVPRLPSALPYFFFFALFSFSPLGADPPGEDGGHLTHSIQTAPAALQEGAEA